MKRLICVIVSLCTLMVLSGCSNNAQQSDSCIDSVTSLTCDGVPIISDLLSLRDYLNRQKDADILSFSFRYEGRETLSAQMLARMTNAYYISCNNIGDRYDIVITEFPGDRIVDAWRSGNTSMLDDNEIKSMNMAVNMVNHARERAEDDYDFEVIIHDMLTNHITYFDDNLDVKNANDIRRHLTVLGALLDGEANCQGYSDAFYTLGSIAGFKVGRMSVETPDDLHMTNIICFNGIWYILDVTYNDQDSEGVTNYRLFNAGMDVLREYSWQTYNQFHPIASVSDSFFYYNHYGLVYADIQSMSQEMAEEWVTNGTKTLRGMVKYEDGAQFEDVIKNAIIATGKVYSYNYSYYHNDRDAYFTVVFN